MERLPPPLLRSYGVLYSVLRGSPSKEEDEISRDVLRTVRVETGHFFDFSGKMKEDLASTSHRILNAIARVDGMGYCQGENYVVDIMLKAGLPEQETFCLFLYALRQQHLHGIFRKEVPVLTEYLEKFEEHLQRDLPKLYSHFKEQNYSAPLYALEWITTLFALAARPLVALAILDLFLSSARNPILRLCLAMLSLMESELLPLDQEGLLREFRRIAVGVDEEEVMVQLLVSGCTSDLDIEVEDGTGSVSTEKTESEGKEGDGELPEEAPNWSLSTAPDFLLVLRANACLTEGLVELHEKAGQGLPATDVALQDALQGVNRSQGWETLRITWLHRSVAKEGPYDRILLANRMLQFSITHGVHSKAIGFILGLCGADVNCLDEHLLSPLHVAALYNRPDAARLLLMCGAATSLHGGVTQAYQGRMWTPEAMAKEACDPDGLLAQGMAHAGGHFLTQSPFCPSGTICCHHDSPAGMSTGPAALQVIRGLICLQCNSKLAKPRGCRNCGLTFCKSCMGTNHFCIRVNGQRKTNPRPLAAQYLKYAPHACRHVDLQNADDTEENNMYSVPGQSTGELTGRTNKRSNLSGHSRQGEETRDVLGGTLKDGWQALFSWQTNQDQKKTQRTSNGSEKNCSQGKGSESDSTLRGLSPVQKWERNLSVSNPKDRNDLLDHAAGFMQKSFPTQAWLQHHLEEEMGLPISWDEEGTDNPHRTGGPIKGLGMCGERFSQQVLAVADSTQLHRRLSWVMGESGVPWEEEGKTWCCPECFRLFSLSLFRHHCRGCGTIYCKDHVPPTPVPPNENYLKLCRQCVIEGAAGPEARARFMSCRAPLASSITSETSSPTMGEAKTGTSGSEEPTSSPFMAGLKSLLENIGNPARPIHPPQASLGSPPVSFNPVCSGSPHQVAQDGPGSSYTTFSGSTSISYPLSPPRRPVPQRGFGSAPIPPPPNRPVPQLGFSRSRDV